MHNKKKYIKMHCGDRSTQARNHGVEQNHDTDLLEVLSQAEIEEVPDNAYR
jgi:hypothetical protein